VRASVSTTLVSWVPRIDALGLYPTVESVGAQAILVLCAIYAAFVAMRPSAPSAEAAIDDRAARGAKL
jgi:hypothetical protein